MQPFLFVVPVAPAHLRNPLRTELFRQCVNALRAQTSNGWECLLIADRYERFGTFQFVPNHITSTEKEIARARAENAILDRDNRLATALEHIADARKPPRHVLILDDDDIVSSTIVDRVLGGGEDHDVIADEMHSFFDVTIGKFKFWRSPTMAISVIHKTEHIFAPAQSGKPVFLANHYTDWHRYYADKSVGRADALAPIFVRMASPASASSQSARRVGQTDITKEDMGRFYRNRAVNRGLWCDARLGGFDHRQFEAVARFWRDRYSDISVGDQRQTDGPLREDFGSGRTPVQSEPCPEQHAGHDLSARRRSRASEHSLA